MASHGLSILHVFENENFPPFAMDPLVVASPSTTRPRFLFALPQNVVIPTKLVDLED